MKPAITLFMLLCLVLCQGCQTTHSPKELTVRELTLPASGVSHHHNLAHTADNNLIVSWVETHAKTNTLRFATYHNGSWLPSQTVLKTDHKLAASPQILGMSDGSLAALWMESVNNPKDRYAADIFWMRSVDNGLTWTAPIKPYNPQARIYDAQMSFAPMPEGKLGFVWTDSRFVNHDEAEDAPNKTSRYQVMANVLGNDGKIGQELVLDDDVCSCCRVFTDAEGDELMTVYRDHLKGEIRDISAARWQEGQVVQRFPVHDDHWLINGCPSNGPSVDLSGNNAVVAWFSAGDGKGTVRLAFTNGEGTLQSPIVIDDHAVGFGKSLLLDDGTALVAWRSNAGPEEKLMLARVTNTGEISHRRTITSGSFPRWPSNYIGLEVLGNQAYIAWTDPVKKSIRLMAVAW